MRKGKGTLENIFVLNHIVQRQRKRADRKVYALFVVLKAVFDNIIGKNYVKYQRQKKIDKRLVARVKNTYEETVMMVITEEGMTSQFKTEKGIRLGCIMSPLLFNIYVADLEKCMEKRGIGVKEKDRIQSIAYADDIVLVAKNREALMDMMDILRRLLRERSLTLNTEKTKVLVFNKTEKERKEKWK